MTDQPLLEKTESKKLDVYDARDRAAKYLDAFADKLSGSSPELHPKLKEFVAVLGPASERIWSFCVWAAAIYYDLYKKVYSVCKDLPWNVLEMIFGIALCFFGGTFLTSIAAIEAFRCLGGKQVWESLCTVWAEGEKAYKAVKEDTDGDGRPKLEQQYEGKELRRQQLMVAMKNVKEPEILQTALVFLYTSWISVLATLQLQFARTTALAMGISECLKLPLTLLFGKALTFALGNDLSHWGDTTIDTSLKIVAVMFAWQIQIVISAFYSALRGGRMFAEGLIHLMAEKGALKHLPDSLAPKAMDPEERERGLSFRGEAELDMDSTYLDEMLMFPLAAAGFFFQYSNGFTFMELPLVIKLILLPLEIIEWILEWKITWG